MSDTLSKSQCDDLASDLKLLQEEFESLLSLTESSAQPVKLKDNAGRLSRMDEMHNQSILLANRNLTKRRLKQTLIALEKIKLGSYGDCSMCDEPISFNRLKAYPEATMCIQCKSAAET
ncbi:MAG: DnaK suppressor protein [Flavobacterium sp.]|jgi:DnaK suppressor protein